EGPRGRAARRRRSGHLLEGARRGRVSPAPGGRAPGHGMADPALRLRERHEVARGQGRVFEHPASRAVPHRQRGRAHGLAAPDRRAGRPGRRSDPRELRRALAARATAVKNRVEAGPATPPPAPQDRRLVPAEKLLLTLLVEGSETLAAALLELHEPDMENLRSAAILRAARAHAADGKSVSRASLED